MFQIKKNLSEYIKNIFFFQIYSILVIDYSDNYLLLFNEKVDYFF